MLKIKIKTPHNICYSTQFEHMCFYVVAPRHSRLHVGPLVKVTCPAAYISCAERIKRGKDW